ncbi:uncharacterized protein [Dermacentor albipictus]|uniref:uncharacterized protein isoform X2 n=1 Tax=Dermacentor albipictus TaxID=60249 RepID=UPI0038FBE901
MQQLTAKSVSKLQRVIGDAFGRTFNTATRQVSNNAYNKTLTWRVLDRAYAHVRPHSYSGFFDMYLQACRMSVNASKRSMRRPRNIVLHAPGIANVILYGNLVAREVIVESSRLAAAPADPPHLLPVLAAFVGTEICKQLLTIAHFLLRYDGSFRRVLAPKNREDYGAPLEYYERLVRGPRFADRFTRGELREINCNLALPSMGSFRRAFKCEAHHRLVTNFTWPEPDNVNRAVAA